jgi:hypothetical protein
MATCWDCDSDLGAIRKVGREEICAGCQAWIHCCKNCRFWDGRARACDEPAAEWVHDRERANFCDFFALRAEDRVATPRRPEDDRPAGGRDAFDALFKR